MGTPHKHYDVIVAWAAGEDIEWRWEDSEPWRPIEFNPAWTDVCQYRIKPKTVKKEGWIAIYRKFTSERIYATAEQCRDDCPNGSALIRIEWEEEA